MHNWKYAVLGCVLAAGLMAGCGEAEVDGTQTALTINGEELSMGTAVFDLRYQQAETTAAMEAYGMAQNGVLWDQDGGSDDDGNSRTYGELVKDMIQDSIVEQVVLRQHAADYDLSIEPEVQEMIDEAAKTTFESNAEAMEKAGVSEENIKEVLELSSWNTILFDSMTADVDPVVSDEEAAQSTISYARIKANTETDGEEVLDEEDPVTNEEKEALMEDFLAAVQAEEDPAAADFAAVAEGISDDIFAYTYSFGSDNAYLAAEVIEASAGMADGEICDSVITTEDGYYYVIRMDAAFDKEATDAQKETILAQRKQEAYDTLLQEWVDAAEVTTSEAWDQVELTDSDRWTTAVGE